jgi:hypothetical protein
MLLSCSKKEQYDFELFDKLKEEIIKSYVENKLMNISSITDFDWEYLYIIYPYSSEKMIKELTSIQELNFHTSIMYTDMINLLLFVNSSGIIKALEFPRCFGDFSISSKQRFSREEAKFKVIIYKNWVLLHSNENKDKDTPKSDEYLVQKEVLPDIVFDAFYDFKNSLDYEDISTNDLESMLKPKSNNKVNESIRFEDNSLTVLFEEYAILSYSHTKVDYEIILINRFNHFKIFKATRKNLYIWKDNTWVDLGGYYYL